MFTRLEAVPAKSASYTSSSTIPVVPPCPLATNVYTPGSSVSTSAAEVSSTTFSGSFASGVAPTFPATVMISSGSGASPQLSFVAITPLPCKASCTSIFGSASTSSAFRPMVSSVGPTALTNTFFFSVPPITKPPIVTLFPVPQYARVEMFTSGLSPLPAVTGVCTVSVALGAEAPPALSAEIR